MAMTAPLTPAGCDLRTFPAMLLDVARLRDCDFCAIADGDEFKAGVLLWAASWHQIPAGSLPDDDRLLAAFAKVDPRRWRKLRKVALHGWITCDDGRLYHRTIAERALECWLERLNSRVSSGFGNAKRYGIAFDRSAIDEEISQGLALLTALNPASPHIAKAKARQGKAVAASESPEESGDLPPGAQRDAAGMPAGSQQNITEQNIPPGGAETPNQEAWRRATSLLSRGGKSVPAARKSFGAILRDYGIEAADLLASIVRGESLTDEPEGYLRGAARAIAKRRGSDKPPVPDVSQWGDEQWSIVLDDHGAGKPWPAEFGPPPGRPGCVVPLRLQAEFGHSAKVVPLTKDRAG
jgi:hypothetical protein